MKPRSLLLACCVVALTAIAPATASAWAPAGTASIHPGVQTYTEGAQCTANFVFQDGGGTYIGQAAHCSGTGAANETNGCLAGSHPIGTPVEIEGASKPGTLVYNSWITMQQKGEANADACQYNDFALVKVDPADVGKINPSVPFWGGPVGINTTGTKAGETVLSYGNSSLRAGIEVLKPKEGKSVATVGNGWSHTVYTVTPGVPGDSGSAFLDSSGRALGVLSTLALAPLPASNGVSDFNRSYQYMQANFGPATLVNGTEAFRGKRFPV